MAATSVRDAEISTETGERPLDLLGTELELARLLTGKETAEEHQVLDLIAWKMLEGAQNVRWLWTVILVALALLVVGFFAPSL
jgi:hypothetical protein